MQHKNICSQPKNLIKSKKTQPLYAHTYIHTISSARHCKNGEQKIMAEEIKPTKTIVEESAEQKNIKLGVAFCVVFSVGFCSGVFLTLSGFFG
jgi:hypothetical protein